MTSNKLVVRKSVIIGAKNDKMFIQPITENQEVSDKCIFCNKELEDSDGMNSNSCKNCE